MPVIVYKLGGSLLDLPDLPDRLRAVLAQRPDKRPLIVAGGGAAAGIVREWERVHKLGDERAHWLALRAMEFNENLLLKVIPETRLVPGRPEAERAWRAGRVPVLCARAFLSAEESGCDLPLPHKWEATSDSIAAWVTLRWPADELVLLKSIAPPANTVVAESGSRGAVDTYFRHLGSRLPRIGWVNLRENEPRIVPWIGDSFKTGTGT